MQFPWAALALTLSIFTETQAQLQCKKDICLKAINGNKSLVKAHKSDCSSFLATTVTPAAKTVMKTKTVTKTKTINPRATKTNTVRTTVTVTSSVAVTNTKRVTTTVFDDQTFTTSRVTGTITITAQDSNSNDDFATEAGIGRRAVRPTPAYASVCGARKSYKSACLCAGAQAKTITARRPTLTGTTTKTQTVTVTGKPTTLATRQVTSKNTVSVTKTFTTVIVTRTVATSSVARTQTTKTVNIGTTQTVQPAAIPTGARIGKISMETDWSGVQLYLAPQLTRWTPREWATTGNGIDQASIYKYSGPRQPLKQIRAPSWEESEGLTIFHDPSNAQFGPSGGDGIISRFSPSTAAASLASKCIIDVDKKFQCVWDDAGIYGDWWMCNGYIALVKPGADAAAKCTEDNENTFKIKALRWNDVDVDDTPTSPLPSSSDSVTPTLGSSINPQPTAPAFRYGNLKLRVEGINEETILQSPMGSEPNAYGLTGTYGSNPVGDILKYRDTQTLVIVVESKDTPGANGKGFFHDPRTARFGPANGRAVMSYLTAWTAPSSMSDETAFSNYGSKCVIDASTNLFQCYWDDEGGDFAEWWFCSGYLSLAKKGTTLSQMQTICDFGNRYTRKLEWVKWADVDESTTTTQSSFLEPSTPTPTPTPSPSTNPGAAASGVRKGKVILDQWQMAVQGLAASEPNAYELSGTSGNSGDVFKYNGPKSSVTVVGAANINSVGMGLYYDPQRSRFGPSNGSPTMSYIAAWSPSSGSDAQLGLKCTIDAANNDFKCYWSDSQFAEFWWCAGYLSAVKAGTTREQMQAICNFGNFYTQKISTVKWQDYDESSTSTTQPPIADPVTPTPTPQPPTTTTTSSVPEESESPGRQGRIGFSSGAEIQIIYGSDSFKTSDIGTGDTFKFDGDDLSITVLNADDPSANGQYLCYDPQGEQFGPRGGASTVSYVKVCSAENKSIRCTYNKPRNIMQCKWYDIFDGSDDFRTAEWWVCNDQLALVPVGRPSSDVRRSCRTASNLGSVVGWLSN